MYYNEEFGLIHDDHLEMPDLALFPASKKDLRRLHYHDHRRSRFLTLPNQKHFMRFWSDPAQIAARTSPWTGHHVELDEHWDDYYKFVNSVSLWEDMEMCGEVALEGFLMGFVLGLIISKNPGGPGALTMAVMLGGMFSVPVIFMCPFSDDLEEDISDEMELPRLLEKREERYAYGTQQPEAEVEVEAEPTGAEFVDGQQTTSRPLNDIRFERKLRRKQNRAWWKHKRTRKGWAGNMLVNPDAAWRDDEDPDETSRYYGF